MNKSFVLGLAVTLSTSIALAETTVRLDEMRLAEQVYALRPDLAIGNPSVIVVRDGREGVLIDAGTPDNGKILRDWLKGRGIDRIRFLILSHDHTDHVWGAQTFAGDTPTVIATAEQAARLSADVLHGTNEALDPRVRPTLWVEGGLTLRVGSQSLRIFRPLYRRSHTDGDLFVFIQPANVLYAGDHLFADRFPVVDTEGGGNLWGYLANVDWLVGQTNDTTRWIAGHGAFSPREWRSYSRAEVAAWLSRLRASIAEISKMRSEGFTLEAAQTRGVGKQFEDLGERPRFVKPAAWIASVYLALDQCEQSTRERSAPTEPSCVNASASDK